MRSSCVVRIGLNFEVVYPKSNNCNARNFDFFVLLRFWLFFTMFKYIIIIIEKKKLLLLSHFPAYKLKLYKFLTEWYIPSVSKYVYLKLKNYLNVFKGDMWILSVSGQKKIW